MVNIHTRRNRIPTVFGQQASTSPRSIRFWFIAALLSLALIGITWRLLTLMLLEPGFLQQQGEARAVRIVEIPAYRGVIYDRNYEPLAVTTPVYSVWLNPQQFEASKENITQLSQLLHLSADGLSARLSRYLTREFMYVKRALMPEEAEAVRALAIPGVYLQREFRRFYPAGPITAHVVGFTNIDEHGQEGIELAYDHWLKGVPGRKRILRDRLGNVIADLKILSEPQPGNDLVLSIDKRIQYIAYRELKAAVDHLQAKSASLVLVNVKTGELLAMVNYPSFNSNLRERKIDASYRNRAVTDLVEPGSVIKGVTIANALASGLYTPDTVVDTSPGRIKIGKYEIKDVRNFGKLDVKGILQKSSNVGISKITLSLPEDSLWHLLKSFGFGERTDVQFPGESAGQLPKPSKWHPFVLATWSFGYGFSVTPLQLAQAYAILANQGKKQPLTLLKQEPAQLAEAEQIVPPEIAQQVLYMLERVVKEEGTGRRAALPGYRVAGKTGTVRVVGEQGYAKDRHIGSFVGIVPVSDPQFVAVVIIQEPSNAYYYQNGQAPFGGLVAAPVFAKVMQEVLRLLNIPPDNYQSDSV